MSLNYNTDQYFIGIMVDHNKYSSWNGPHAVRVEVAQSKSTAEWGRGPYDAQTSQNPYNANSDPVNCKNGTPKSV